METSLYEELWQTEQTHWWFVARRRIVWSAITSHLPEAQQRRLTICELGCGTGGNIAAWADRHDVAGIDASPHALKFARQRLGDRVQYGSLPDDIPFEPYSFDVVLATDVFEHIEDDAAAVQAALALVRPGGILLATVPAYQWLYSPRDAHHHHYRRYGKAAFRQLFRGEGVKLELLSHYNTVLFAPAALVRLYQKLVAKEVPSQDLRIPRPAVNGLLTQLFALEGGVVPRVPMPFGLSLLAVARREHVAFSPPAKPARSRQVVTQASSPHRARLPLGLAKRRPAKPATTIVVPCYNEAERLDRRQFMDFAGQADDLKFLLVNDGSTDGTLDALRQLEQARPNCFEVLNLPQNCGKAEAVRQGLLRAVSDGAQLVGFWDADLATPLEAIDEFRSLLEGRPELHLAIGSRTRLLGRRIERRWSRHLFGRVFATLVSWVLQLNLYDTQCGAKLFRASDSLRSLLESPFCSRWIFDVELLARMSCLARRDRLPAVDQIVYELPLQEWTDVAGSKLKPSDFMKAAFELLTIYRKYMVSDEWSTTLEPTHADSAGRRAA